MHLRRWNWSCCCCWRSLRCCCVEPSSSSWHESSSQLSGTCRIFELSWGQISGSPVRLLLSGCPSESVEQHSSISVSCIAHHLLGAVSGIPRDLLLQTTESLEKELRKQRCRSSDTTGTVHGEDQKIQSILETPKTPS